MGIFSTKKTVLVSSTVYNMAGDEDSRPNFMKNSIFAAVMSPYDVFLGETLVRNYLSGPGLGQRNFLNWSIRQNYPGLPNFTVTRYDTIDPAVVAPFIPTPGSPPGLSVYVQSAHMVSGDYEHVTEKYVLENFADEYDTAYVSTYDPVTNDITIEWAVGGPPSDEVFDAGTYDPDKVYIVANYYHYIPTELLSMVIGSTTIGDIVEPDVSGYTLLADRSAPVNSTAPVISGTLDVGDLLTTTNGTWDYANEFTYTWYRDAVLITGATSNTYTTVRDDGDAAITSKVTAIGDGTTSTLSPVSNSLSINTFPGYLYYEFDVTAVDGGTFVSCAEIEALLSTVSAIFGSANTGTTSASSTASNYSSDEAFSVLSGEINEGWLTSSGVTGWLKWTDGGTIDVRSFAVSPIPGGLTAAPKDFTFRYSDNDIDWTVALTVTGETSWGRSETRVFDIGSNGAHKYWEINITDSDGSSQVGLLSLRPVLADGSVVSLVTKKVVTTTKTQFNTTETPTRLTDGNTTLGWTSSSGTTNYVMISFAALTHLDEITWRARVSEGARSPKDFTIKGSNDFVTWVTLKTVTGETGWASNEKRSFIF